MNDRNYNVGCGLITSVVGALLVGLLWSGHILNALTYVTDLLPSGDLGLLAHPAKDEFIRASVTPDGQRILLEKEGDYRIFLAKGAQPPQGLAIEAAESGKQVELVSLPGRMTVYSPELVDMEPFLDFHIDEPGDYTVGAPNQGGPYHLTIAPNYMTQNRLRVMICLSAPLAGLILVGLIKYLPAKLESKRRAREKRQRLDKWM